MIHSYIHEDQISDKKYLIFPANKKMSMTLRDRVASYFIRYSQKIHRV